MGTFLVVPSPTINPTTPVLLAGLGTWREGISQNNCAQPTFVIPPGVSWWNMNDGFNGGCASSPPGTVATVAWNFSSLQIYLDGAATPISINELPSGFLISSPVQFHVGLKNPTTGNPENNVNTTNRLRFNISCFPQVSPFVVANHSIYSVGIERNFDDSAPNIYDVMGLGLFEATITVLLVISGPRWFVELDYNSTILFPYNTNRRTNFNGSYSIWSSTITLTQTANAITITDPAGNLDEIEEVRIVNPDDLSDVTVMTITSQTPTEIVINNPGNMTFWLLFLFLQLNGGSVFAGVIPVVSGGGSGDIIMTGSGGFELDSAATVVNNVDASGLYFLNPNKTNDTLYLRNPIGADPIDTEVVKIPNPKIKTFYAGG